MLSRLDSVPVDKLAFGSIAVGVTVLVVKLVAWWLTGSVALYSDALESFVNVATAIVTLGAIRYGARPADANHPYGHHKVEYFSVALEAALITVAAVLIIVESAPVLLAPRALNEPGVGLAVNLLATAINAAWSFVLLREGRRRRSPALAGDGTHLLTDVITSVGVIVGLLLALATGWLILDPLLAIAVAINILWHGWKLLRESVAGLMDEALAPEQLTRIREIIRGNAGGAIEAHDLRTRAAGSMTFVEFHLVVPGAMSVADSHAICDRIEKALRVEVADATITIHVEPEEKAKHAGAVVI
jgi:cation diffusion facilitator family transporter